MDVMMRLPPIYLMDMLLVYNMGVSSDSNIQTVNPVMEDVNITEHISNSTDLYQTFSTLYGGSPVMLVIPHILRFLSCILLYVISFFMFLLPSESLIKVYQYLTCLSVIPISYASHKMMVELSSNR